MSAIVKRGIVLAVTIVVSMAGLMVAGAPAYSWVYCNYVSEVTDTASGRILYPTYGNYNPDCDMRINETSSDAGVRAAINQLQQSLNRCYGPNRVTGGSYAPPYTVTNELSEDSKYGPRTREAVRAVQRYLNNRYGAGLAEDGYAGPKTRSRMIHETAGSGEEFCTPPKLPIEIN
ncbi:Putative peptidoglycan binding domain-containing protein [Nonomuraea solani]|uniref:Putative peptidoglycan binding domain-containing protein n=1 Tax=Nonomuraea solani TaxID=1144553 RepID=A0A1H6C349_9ACTN|nr:peptidoglycan-binding domain-containing protein [Nonomuraea solani]SEG67430.1 Putative peptidoglycan binding domain-containing protein [Nonomuraea solani]